MSNLPLFDDRKIGNLSREVLSQKLSSLADEGIYIGTSSWKYEGWLGQIYTHERYQVRGRFSRKKFEQTSLAEYAETFPVVGGDFSFYQFPTADYWGRLFDGAPERLKFALKVPEEITVQVWPRHARCGPRAGARNPSFLDAELFGSGFAGALEPYHDRVAVLMFEFGAFPHASYPEGVEQFAADLNPFLRQLPQKFRYAVEVRNPEFLQPPYFDCLKANNTAHVFSSWSRMPSLAEQSAIPEAFTLDFSVCRALLRPGRSYAEAVRRFSPYAGVLYPYPEGRDALRSLLEKSRKDRKSAFIFVNNCFEGNAPESIAAVICGQIETLHQP